MNSGFTIDEDKLKVILQIIWESTKVSRQQVEGYLLADWPEGTEHQNWLDCAEPEYIAAWVVEWLRSADWESNDIEIRNIHGGI